MNKLKNIKDFILKHNLFFQIIILYAFFFAVDITMRYYCINSNYFYPIYNFAPFLFTLSISSLHILITLFAPKKIGVTYFILVGIFYIIMYCVQFFHNEILGNFFTFSEIFLAGEGAEFSNAALSYINHDFILVLLAIIALFIVNLITLLRRQPAKIKWIKLYGLTAVIMFQVVGVIILYIDNNGYNSDNPYSLIYNYKEFEIPYRSIQTTGFIQHPLQDIVIYYINQISEKIRNEQYKKELDKFFSYRNLETSENKYTGIFQDKNLIYIMLESGDNWLITENTMPTLYKLKETGWDFTNRYSPFFYGGYTFNAEFAANTGIYLTEGFSEYENNYYPYSLPNLFKNAEYKVNSFHMNDGEFYNRNTFHKSFGYEHYYGNYNNNEKLSNGYDYAYDVSWVRNEETYNKIINKEERFMSFIITYSMHLPYINNGICEQAIRDGKITYEPWEDRENICLYELAYQSDLFLKELIEKLDQDDLLEDTILVIFADHNTYGYSDKEFLSKVKGTNDLNLQQKTTLIIWGTDIEAQKIDILMDTADLVPTLANLFRLDYDANNYLATDIFSENHDDYIYFQYGEWLTDNNKYSKEENDDNMTKKVIDIINYNKYVLKTNYYK